MAFDFKKEFKNLYAPAAKPSIIEVPPMRFLAVDGHGDPNDPHGEYSQAVSLLSGLSYAIKMSKRSLPEQAQLPGCFDYVVPPLEGLWWSEGDGAQGVNLTDKSAFHWISMIRVPDFVTPEVFAWAQETLAKKHPESPVSTACLFDFNEGLVAQVLHRGPYDEEPETVERLDSFISESGFVPDFSDTRYHHEIYLSDPRRAAPEKMKTILRHPVAKS